MQTVRTWIVTDGGAGFEVQAVGIAEALGLKPELKRVKQGAPWHWLAPWGPAVARNGLAPPWPDLVIAAGRQSIPFARMIRRRSRGRTFVAVLQDPRVAPSNFDFVWVPAHDKLRGPNVLVTVVSPHRITAQRLAEEAEKFAPSVAHLPHPRLAVLIGGANAVYTFDEAAASRVGAQLAQAARNSGGSLMVTPSRRTGEAQTERLRDAIAGVPSVMWDGKSDNPYFGYLGNADAIAVTCDSVNMVGEAAGTGKPVYIVPLEGGSPKSARFLEAIMAQGAARPLGERIESWSYAPLNATAEIAHALGDAYAAHRTKRINRV